MELVVHCHGFRLAEDLSIDVSIAYLNLESEVLAILVQKNPLEPPLNATFYIVAYIFHFRNCRACRKSQAAIDVYRFRESMAFGGFGGLLYIQNKL